MFFQLIRKCTQKPLNTLHFSSEKELRAGGYWAACISRVCMASISAVVGLGDRATSLSVFVCAVLSPLPWQLCKQFVCVCLCLGMCCSQPCALETVKPVCVCACVWLGVCVCHTQPCALATVQLICVCACVCLCCSQACALATVKQVCVCVCVQFSALYPGDSAIGLCVRACVCVCVCVLF